MSAGQTKRSTGSRFTAALGPRRARPASDAALSPHRPPVHTAPTGEHAAYASPAISVTGKSVIITAINVPIPVITGLRAGTGTSGSALVMRHTLAVVRLRKGQPADVRRLCADALAADLDRDDRATVLATVAMAKHQLYLLASARQVLDEALALDPSADLVPEAVSMLSAGPAPFAATPTRQ